ncbi:MAG: hypothetical protein QW707_05605 [Candidatus Bathyarchaeia archaeon]
MSEETETAVLEAIRILTSPQGNEAFTVTEIPDNKLLVQITALKTIAEISGDDVLSKFVENLAIMARSRKRKGAKELVEILRGARARVLQTTVLSGVKRILVGRGGGLEGEIE